MPYTQIPVPDGFYGGTGGFDFTYQHRTSYIKWQGSLQVDNGRGAPDGKFYSQSLPLAFKERKVIQPHPAGGTVAITINVTYSLLRLKGAYVADVEADMFLFGCAWPYTFSQDQLTFGPVIQYTSPEYRSGKILQGVFEQIQSKDQGAKGAVPWVYAVPKVYLKSTPDDHQGWTLQLPVYGGPSYTPPGTPGTPEGDPLAGVWLELEVRVPSVPVPKPIPPKPILLPDDMMATLVGPYALNQQELRGKARETVDGWLNKLVSRPDCKDLYRAITMTKKDPTPILRVTGATDGTGSPDINDPLSALRAEGVKEALLGRLGKGDGGAERSIVTKGIGENRAYPQLGVNGKLPKVPDKNERWVKITVDRDLAQKVIAEAGQAAAK